MSRVHTLRGFLQIRRRVGIGDMRPYITGFPYIYVGITWYWCRGQGGINDRKQPNRLSGFGCFLATEKTTPKMVSVGENRQQQKNDRKRQVSVFGSQPSLYQAISYGRFFKTEKKNPKLCFPRVFTCFTPGVEPNGARSSQEYFQSFSKRYLDPFLFCPGASFEFFAMFPL